jgi:hypothetical protein
MATEPVFFPTGKLPADLLGRLLSDLEGHPRLLVGPRVGEDAAVIDMGDRCLIVKFDPITFAEKRIGWYAVHVNANDIACMGAAPAWSLAILLLPEGRADENLVARSGMTFALPAIRWGRPSAAGIRRSPSASRGPSYAVRCSGKHRRQTSFGERGPGRVTPSCLPGWCLSREPPSWPR